jgi:hypothetical protein
MEPEILVTLVHGTFASDATWIEPDSALCGGLKARFGKKIFFEPFRWLPANNNIWARIKAAKCLASHLERLQEKHPNASQYIIAHSHGGNIALLAGLYSTQLPKRCPLAGIACLSTPFLHASIRDLGQLTMVSLMSGFYGILLPLGCLLIFLTGSPGWMVGVWLIVSNFLSAAASGFVSGRAQAFMSRHQIKPDVMRDALQTHAPLHNLLIVRGAGDEASLGLGAAQLFSRLFSMIFNRIMEMQINPHWWSWRLLTRSRDSGWIDEMQAERLGRLFILKRPTKILWIVWVVFVTALTMSVIKNGIPHWTGGEYFDVPAIVWVGVMLIFATCALKTTLLDYLIYPAAFILFTCVAALGVTSWGTVPTDRTDGGIWTRLGMGIAVALLVEVTAEPVPLGEWTVTQLGHDIAGVQPSHGLRHSIYEDLRVHRRLIDWIEWSENNRGNG